MKVIVLGTGYVGIASGVCLSNWHQVVCLDIDERKIQLCKNGIPPIFEPGLEELMKKNISNGNLTFDTNLSNNIKDVDLILLCVGTPENKDGSVDMSYVWKASEDISDALKLTEKKVIVSTKSTVPPGTGKKIEDILLKKNSKDKFAVASNPEFLREGSAISDFLNPDRIVIGSNDSDAIIQMEKFYKPFTDMNFPLMKTTLENSEMIKYASNCAIANRISFINDIANICDLLGANIDEVKAGMSYDKRIGSLALNAGCGYGGSCFPKDVQGLYYVAKELGYEAEMLKKTHDTNEKQKIILIKKVLKYFNNNIKNLNFAVLGLTFKPNTDDIKNSPAIAIIDELIKNGAQVKAFDPQGMKNFEKYIGNNQVKLYNSTADVLENSDAIIICSDWEEFKKFNYSGIKNINNKVIFDGRNCLNKKTLSEQGFQYFGIGL